MSYLRVIPRDLFNEGNLLKCYGKLWVELENAGVKHKAKLTHLAGDEAFDIVQDKGYGGLYIANVELTIDDQVVYLERSLNSRDPWPLYVVPEQDDPIPVFTGEGKLSQEFLNLIGADL